MPRTRDSWSSNRSKPDEAVDVELDFNIFSPPYAHRQILSGRAVVSDPDNSEGQEGYVEGETLEGLLTEVLLIATFGLSPIKGQTV
jgi:hypothetical protein